MQRIPTTALTLLFLFVLTVKAEDSDPFACTDVTLNQITTVSYTKANCNPPTITSYGISITGTMKFGGGVLQTLSTATTAAPCNKNEVLRWKLYPQGNGGMKVQLEIAYYNSGSSGPVTILQYDYATCGSPLCISLGNGSAVRFTNRENGVVFDLDSDGVAEQISWTVAGDQIAFFALDLNGNGRVDSGRELLGNFSPQAPPNGDEDANGFRALRLYDLNDDGQINFYDPVYYDLILWVDLNHNGVDEASERLRFKDYIESVNLNYHKLGWRDQYGNFIPFGSTARTHDGATKQVVDVFLR